MKKILTRIAIGLGALILVVLMVLGYLKKEVTECREGQGTVAIEACTMMIDHVSPEAYRFTYLNLRRGHYAVAGSKKEEMEDIISITKLVDGGRVAVPAAELADVYERAAALDAEAGNKEESLKFLDKAIMLGSKDTGAYITRGQAKLAAGKYADAIADLKKAEDLGSKQMQLYVGLGSAYLGASDYNNAYLYLKKGEPMASAQQDVIMVNRQLGLTCFELKIYDEAVAHMTKALLSGPCPDCSAVIKMSQDFINKAKAPKAKPAVKKKKARRK